MFYVKVHFDILYWVFALRWYWRLKMMRNKNRGDLSPGEMTLFLCWLLITPTHTHRGQTQNVQRYIREEKQWCKTWAAAGQRPPDVVQKRLHAGVVSTSATVDSLSQRSCNNSKTCDNKVVMDTFRYYQQLFGGLMWYKQETSCSAKQQMVNINSDMLIIHPFNGMTAQCCHCWLDAALHQ